MPVKNAQGSTSAFVDRLSHLFDQLSIVPPIYPGRCSSMAFLRGLMRDEMERSKIPASRVVLSGFSQGGALSLYTALHHEGAPLAGVAVKSGYLAAAHRLRPTRAALDTHFIFCHGTDDPLVRHDWGKRSADRVRELRTEAGLENGDKVQFRDYRGMAHEVSPRELRDISDWLRDRLPPIDEAERDRRFEAEK